MSAKSPRSVRVKEEMSEDLAALLKHQKQLRDWQSTVQKRIIQLEETYLKETSMGNMIRGFDQDAGGGAARGDRNRSRDQKESDDKEKLFSGSSYPVWLERQNAMLKKLALAQEAAAAAAGGGMPQVASQTSLATGGPPTKKQKNN